MPLRPSSHVLEQGPVFVFSCLYLKNELGEPHFFISEKQSEGYDETFGKVLTNSVKWIHIYLNFVICLR